MKHFNSITALAGSAALLALSACSPANSATADNHQMIDHSMAGHSDLTADHSDMTMGDMMDMLEGKTGDAFDSAFIEGMIPHHQGAIDMARAALESAGHQEIKDMAQEIIDAQQREIDMMKQWQRDWGYTE